MPQEQKARREVLEAIKSIPSIADLIATYEGRFEHELELEVIVYGRNYNGKKVGPYVRLLTYEPGEAIFTQGDWGGNSFCAVVSGQVDVWITMIDQHELKVAELGAGAPFGEMSVLAGVPRNATIRAALSGSARVLEIQRPALRLLRKIKRFDESLDQTYRRYGRDILIQKLRETADLSPELINDLKKISLFQIFSKNHFLFQQGKPISDVYIFSQGWLRRLQTATDGAAAEDYLGCGYCFGLEGISQNKAWPYSATIMGRAEVLKIPIASLRQTVELREWLPKRLAPCAAPAISTGKPLKPGVAERTLATQSSLIDTGLSDATNLLVMDMALCIRCGNCSMACHQIHGQSRLIRKGIHLTRLKSARPSAVQSILAPAVCMHCQDPECLTGCPTGAIGRFGDGQIDINPQTCIGCGDCATQCPYNAVSMIPRRQRAAPGSPTFAAKLARYLKIASDPLPPPIDAIEDLTAVKCNLCRHTALNPPGSKTPAYGCEESCPTGALVRVDPKKYFGEIGNIQGPLEVNQTHAIGRSLHQADPLKRVLHVAGILLTVMITLLAIRGIERYGLNERLIGFLNMRWITGLGSLISTAGIMAYTARRRNYTKRRGPLRYWLLAHYYLGLILTILVLLHSGTSWGARLTSALMTCFLMAGLTGIIGLLSYLILPRLLVALEGAPLLIDELKARRVELRNEIAETRRSPSIPVRNMIERKVVPRFISFSYLLRQFLRREDVDTLLESARAEFQAAASEIINDKDRRQLLQAVVAAAMLRRVDALIYLYNILKIWLIPHVVFTSLMLIFLLLHIVQVLYYAVRS